MQSVAHLLDILHYFHAISCANLIASYESSVLFLGNYHTKRNTCCRVSLQIMWLNLLVCIIIDSLVVSVRSQLNPFEFCKSKLKFQSQHVIRISLSIKLMILHWVRFAIVTCISAGGESTINERITSTN